MNFLDYSVDVQDGVVVLQVHGPVIADSPSLTYHRFDYPEYDRVYVMSQSGDTTDSFALHQWDPAWLKQQEERRLQQEQEEIDRLAARQKRGNDNE